MGGVAAGISLNATGAPALHEQKLERTVVTGRSNKSKVWEAELHITHPAGVVLTHTELLQNRDASPMLCSA